MEVYTIATVAPETSSGHLVAPRPHEALLPGQDDRAMDGWKKAARLTT